MNSLLYFESYLNKSSEMNTMYLSTIQASEHSKPCYGFGNDEIDLAGVIVKSFSVGKSKLEIFTTIL